MLYLPLYYLLLQSTRLDLNRGSEMYYIKQKNLNYVQPTRELDFERP